MSQQWLRSHQPFERQKEYYKELTNIDLREKMYSEKMKEIEESYLPFGIIDDGLGEEEIVDNEGNRWQVERTNRILEDSGHNVFF